MIIFFWSFTSIINAADSLRINIIGIKGPALENANNRLSTSQQAIGNDLNENKIRTIFQSAPDNITAAIKPFGYFKSHIESKLTHHGDSWTATFYVNAGPQLFIKKVDVVLSGPGKYNTELQNLIHHFPIKAGQRLLIDGYNKSIQLLFQTANNQGYLKAYLENKEIKIDLKKYSSVITLHLNTGKRYYFGSVTFNKSPFADSFLQRFVNFHDNQPFSSQDLLKLQQNLGNSQYFQQVLVNPEFDKTQNDQVPIFVETTPRKSQQYKFGIGYGTFTGPRFTAESDWRRVTDTGQRFNLQLKLSPVLSGLAAKYFIPGKNPLTDQYTIGANFQQFVPKNGRSFSETLSTSYVKSVNEWQNTLSLNYLRERFMINYNPWQSSNLLYPSLSITRIKSDDLLNPHSGSAFSFNLQGSSDKLLSQINFIQSDLKGKLVMSPTERSRLIFRGDLGYTVVQDLQKLPLTLQFFAGGPSSVRGYRFDSMGPGRYLKVGSVELQHKIIGDWSAGVFYDAGIAANQFNASAQHSRGIGVIYNSIIGPIKLYVARADSSPGKPMRIDFNIGPEF